MKDRSKGRSTGLLLNDLKRAQTNSNEYFSVGVGEDIHDWKVIIFGPLGTPYENGFFVAHMKFPLSYPDDPPTFIFDKKMFHPNISPVTNAVCISILHKSGDDVYGYESMNERWLPVRNPESIILSIVSLLIEPNCESPANVDAANLYVKDRAEYDRIVRRNTQKEH